VEENKRVVRKIEDNLRFNKDLAHEKEKFVMPTLRFN
jgi:hypothetical protein